MTLSNVTFLAPQSVSAAETGSAGNWMVLVPIGTAMGRDGRGPYTSGDATAMRAIIDRTKERLGLTELMVDYDHQAFHAVAPNVGGTAKASGWVKDYRVTSRGVEGLVQWTAAARAAIRALEYRYLSPVFNHDASGQILSLHSIGLVNTPNLDLEAVAASAWSKVKGKPMEKIAKALGLADGATEDEIVAKIEAIKAGGVDPAQFVPMSVFQSIQAELNKTRSGITEADAKREVEHQVAMGRIWPGARDWAVNLCQTNKAAYDSFLDGVGPVAQSIMTPQLGSRGGTAPQSQRRAGEGDEIATTLGLSAEDVKKYGGA